MERSPPFRSESRSYRLLRTPDGNSSVGVAQDQARIVGFACRSANDVVRFDRDAEVAGVTAAGSSAGAAKYQVESGSYIFTAPWK